jgi:hypothetical protein
LDFRPATAWIVAFTTTRPLDWLLQPFRWVLAPFLAVDGGSFLLALGPALAVVGLHYLWVVRSAVAFEDDSVDYAQKRSARIAAWRSGQRRLAATPTKARPGPFRLASTGRPELAFLWKKVRALHAVQVLNDQILLVIVTKAGRIHQQRGRTRVAVTPLEVEESQRIVSEKLVGVDLGSDFAVSDEALAEATEPVREAILTIVDCVHLAGSASKEVFIGGAERLSGVWNDMSSVRQVLDVLEREAELMKLVAAASETSIQIGYELPGSAMDMAVVSKRYDTGTAEGSVGVIGPMRMNYKRAISAVEEVSRELEDLIGSETD